MVPTDADLERVRKLLREIGFTPEQVETFVDVWDWEGEKDLQAVGEVEVVMPAPKPKKSKVDRKATSRNVALEEYLLRKGVDAEAARRLAETCTDESDLPEVGEVEAVCVCRPVLTKAGT
jgi:hypothetical protein